MKKLVIILSSSLFLFNVTTQAMFRSLSASRTLKIPVRCMSIVTIDDDIKKYMKHNSNSRENFKLELKKAYEQNTIEAFEKFANNQTHKLIECIENNNTHSHDIAEQKKEIVFATRNIAIAYVIYELDQIKIKKAESRATYKRLTPHDKEFCRIHADSPKIFEKIDSYLWGKYQSLDEAEKRKILFNTNQK